MRWILWLAASTALAQTAAPPVRDVMRAAMEKQQAAAARQRESIRKQADNLGVWLAPGVDDPAAPAPLTPPAPSGQASEPPCDAIDDAVVAPIVEAAAKAQALEPKLLRAVIEQESAWRPCAVSPKGAKGLMQLMPDTAEQLGVRNLLDPKENVEGGAKFLKQLLTKYGGDLVQTLGAYNAGPTAVDQAGGIPNIRETRDYVNSIMKKLGGAGAQPPPVPPPKAIEN